jgi:thermitase
MPATMPLGTDNRVADEVIVELQPAADARVDPAVARAGTRGPGGPNRLGLASLDDLLERWQARSVRQVRLSPSPAEASESTAPDAADGSFVRVKLAEGLVDPAEAVAELTARPDVVRAADFNYFRATQQEISSTALIPGWGLEAIRVPEAWEITRGRPAILIAILDTGGDFTHPALRDAWLPNGAVDLVDVKTGDAPDGWHWEGHTSTADGGDPRDDVGHGTHVAGIIAAQSPGDPSRSGVAPGCRLLCVRVLARLVHDDGTVVGYGTAADIAEGIDWAVKRGASVINMSLAFKHGSLAERLALKRAVKAGVVAVAAVGNHGTDGPPLFPASYPEPIAVGAVDANGSRWDGSQTGTHLDVMAPGVDITSTQLHGGFHSLTGTSMATAFVSGLAALMLSAREGLPLDMLRTALERQSRPVVPDRPTSTIGWGTIDAADALRAIAPPT